MTRPEVEHAGRDTDTAGQAHDAAAELLRRPASAARLPAGLTAINAARRSPIRRAYRSEIAAVKTDPQTAPTVRRFLAPRLTGHNVASTARERNEIGVPCPSSADPDRNTHRSGEAWILRIVTAIWPTLFAGAS
ncbi:hypothetical protein [Catellatospora sichuanensis]|uniref:hypothetical protein n=1 Tax=Catellatospora sichuanensis TaxID=1969805 RepID=UPI00118337D0|nr:hypothetical protein [Catellatospora sichuanensis]